MLFDRFLCDACSRVASARAGLPVRRLRRGSGERRARAGGAHRERRRCAAQSLSREGLLRGEGVARRDGDPRWNVLRPARRVQPRREPRAVSQGGHALLGRPEAPRPHPPAHGRGEGLRSSGRGQSRRPCAGRGTPSRRAARARVPRHLASGRPLRGLRRRLQPLRVLHRHRPRGRPRRGRTPPPRAAPRRRRLLRRVVPHLHGDGLRAALRIPRAFGPRRRA